MGAKFLWTARRADKHSVAIHSLQIQPAAARYAKENRRHLRERAVRMLNLVSSPGSGKTTLLTRSIGDLKDRFAICVIEGDQQTSRDAERVAATGIQVVQINTGKACHLDAQMVGRALEDLNLENCNILFVENVGNLVCPADFDLGEEKRVVMISVTEGDDKPLKYPGIFASSDLMVVTKIDLLPYVDFDCKTDENDSDEILTQGKSLISFANRKRPPFIQLAPRIYTERAEL